MTNGFMLTIGVADMNSSIKFYTRCLNFTLLRQVAPAPGVELAFLLFNEQIEIELVHRTGVPPANNRDTTVTLSFRTADINSEYKRLQALDIPSLQPPASIPSGIWFLRFTDPDGTPLAYIQE